MRAGRTLPDVRNGLRPAASFVVVVIVVVAAILVVLSVRLGGIGSEPTASPPMAFASPTPPNASGLVAIPRPSSRPSPQLITLPPAPPTFGPTGAPIPDPTPWPAWLVIPKDVLWDPDDPDRDGLKNDREHRIGTEDYQYDSDYGGEGDGNEVAAGRDPLDKSDDVPEKSACIPEGAERPDVPSSDETPPPAPELERLLPKQIAGVDLQVGSMRGLPRIYGFFNFFWDALLLCAGGQPDDLSHALGIRGELPGFTVLAIHVDGANHRKLAHDLLSDLEAGDYARRLVFDVDVDGRDVLFMYDADVDGVSFATYVSGDVLFLMTDMGYTDSGLWPGGAFDPEYVRELVGALPPP